VSKVRRGGPKKPVRRRTRAKSAAVPAPRRLRNWVEAQVRSARYRVANAARLGGIALAGVAAVTVAGLALFGQLDDVRQSVVTHSQVQLAKAGFAVETIDVSGAQGVIAHNIVEATGLQGGYPIFAVDPEEIRARVEALPMVRSASVARLWPNSVAVVVETREAFALWQVEGQLNIIDRYGVVMGQADVMAPPALPLVVAEGANDSVVEIVEALDRHPTIRDEVVGAVRVGERRWNLRLENGADIKLPEGDVNASMAILARLHSERGVLRLAAESFDMRGQGDLIVRALPDRAAEAGMAERDA